VRVREPQSGRKEDTGLQQLSELTAEGLLLPGKGGVRKECSRQVEQNVQGLQAGGATCLSFIISKVEIVTGAAGLSVTWYAETSIDSICCDQPFGFPAPGPASFLHAGHCGPRGWVTWMPAQALSLAAV
jgi:hypothetical protein